MKQKRDKIFLACNYSNKKVKEHFNRLKDRLEAEWAVRVVLLDRERARGARELWKDIRMAIEDCSLSIFDVSAFRPNAVLELGYALAVKDEETIVITFDERKPRSSSKKPEWLLSDVGHLNQVRYRTLAQMDEKIDENLEKVPLIRGIKAFIEDARSKTAIPDKYRDACLKVLQKLRTSVTLTDQQIDGLLKGTSVPRQKLTTLMKKHDLAWRDRGPHGRWYLVEEK